MMKALAVISLLLAAASVRAGDLAADTETVLRHMADDPGSVFTLQTASTPSITVRGDTVQIRIIGLKAAPRANPAAGLTIGDVAAETRRREDGGLVMTIDLSRRMAFKGLSAPANHEIEFADGRLVLEWGKALAEIDAMDLSAAKMTLYDDGVAAVVFSDIGLRQRRTGADGHDGSFSIRLGGIVDAAKKAPVSLVGWGPLEFSGRYENFPRELYRDQTRHLMVWEAARAARGDAPVNLDLAGQGAALMREAQTRYRIDRFLFKTPMVSVQAEGDYRFSLDAARGLTGTMTAWISDTGKPDLLNPMLMAGSAVAKQFGEEGKTPEGEPARVFRIGLAADGSATLNGKPSPELSASIGSSFKTMSLAMSGFAAPRQPVAGVSPIPGATNCGVPVYPADSLAAKETGRTNLSFIYTETGAIALTGLKTSGFPRLDEAARIAFVSCRFPKGTTEVHIPVDWKIDNGRGSAVVGPELSVK